MNSHTNWGRRFKQNVLKNMSFHSEGTNLSHQKRGSTSDRFQKTLYALTTALAVATPDKKKQPKSLRLSTDLQQLVTHYSAQKNLAVSVAHSFQAIVDQCPDIADELLSENSLPSFRDSTAYTEQELESLRETQKTIADAIAVLEQKPAAHKAAEEVEGNIVQKLVTWIGSKVFDEKKEPASQLSLIENIQRLKKEIALTSSIEKSAFQKAVNSIPKLSFFERMQNGVLGLFGRKSKVAQSRENLISRITLLHENTARGADSAKDSLKELSRTLQEANKNIARRIQTIETLQDQFKREKESALAGLSVVEHNVTKVLALKPQKETKINENLKASKNNLQAIERELVSIHSIETRKKSIDVPVDAVQEETDRMMAEMLGSENETISQPQEVLSNAIDAEQQEIDSILEDIDTDLRTTQSDSTVTASSVRVSTLQDKNKALKEAVAHSYRVTKIALNSSHHFNHQALQYQQQVASLKQDLAGLEPSRIGLETISSKKEDITNLQETTARQLEKQHKNMSAINQGEHAVEERRIETSNLLLECKKSHLTALSELATQKIAHCSQLIVSHEMQLQEVSQELLVEPTENSHREFESFSEIYAVNIKRSGLSGEIQNSLKKCSQAHQKALILKKELEEDMKKHQEAIINPDHSFLETAKEMFASFIQNKPEAEIHNHTEIERIDAAIAAGENCLENLEKFHNNILAYKNSVARINNKKEAFRQAFLEAKQEIATLNSLVANAEKEEIRQKNVEQSAQSIVAAASIATGADEESVFENIVSSVMTTVSAIVAPNLEMVPMMSEEAFAKIARLESNERLKAVERLVLECEALSEEIARCKEQGYDTFKKGNGLSKIQALREKSEALMCEMHSATRKGELEFGLAQTLVSACSALQHAATTALLNTLLAIPVDETTISRTEQIQEAEMWVQQAEEWLDAQEETLHAEGQETVRLHRLMKVQNWLNLQRKNYELIMRSDIESDKDKELILSEKALYEESVYLLNMADEAIKQHEAAKQTLREYKEKITHAKMHKVETVAVEVKPAVVSATVSNKDATLQGNSYTLFQPVASQPARDIQPNLVRRGLNKAMAILSAVVVNTSAWVSSLIESGGAGFL